MTDLLLPALAGFLLMLEFFSRLAGYSLQGFSRSRLDEICRANQRESRFGVILKRHDEGLIAVEILALLNTLALLAVAIAWLGLWNPSATDTAGWIAYVAGWLGLVVFLLLVAIVLPWTTARVAGETFLFRVWPLLETLVTALKPVLAVVRMMDTFAHRLTGRQEPTEGNAATITEEIRTVVDEGQREGVLESEARTMIHRVMELQEEDTAAIMTPRTEMICIGVDSTFEEARSKLLEAGHSRIPVIGETTDDIVGILYAKDLLKHIDTSNGRMPALRTIVREPRYVPETTRIDTLLETMKRDHVHFAIVIDEYGGVAGLVTMEDILEEIVGEIVDEFDAAEETGIHAVAPNVIEVDSRVHIDDLNDQFEFELPEDGDFDTIGGFVFNQLGHVPKEHEHLTWRELRITVLEADKRKIHRLKIEKEEGK